mgnify:CR=1 FL=1
MSSTLLLEAASNSKILKEAFWANDLHELHSLQGSKSVPGFTQLMAFARIRAHVFFPTPRGPQNKKDCASFPEDNAFFNVSETCSCPTTSKNLTGRYLRAETMKLSML